jgi:hypothetical protein
LPSASLTVAISLPPPDVSDRLVRLRASVEEFLECLFDVVDGDVADGCRHALAVAARVQADLLVPDTKPGVVRLVHVRPHPGACCKASAVPFDEISAIVGRSPNATKMLASRARRRVQGAAGASGVPGADPARQREIVGAFLAASRRGDFEALLAVLDPGVALRADEAAVRMGAPAQLRGPAAVANTFSGRAMAARLALIDGAAGAVWSQGGQPRIVFRFTVIYGKVAAIDILADPEHLRQLDLAIPGE